MKKLLLVSSILLTTTMIVNAQINKMYKSTKPTSQVKKITTQPINNTNKTTNTNSQATKIITSPRTISPRSSISQTVHLTSNYTKLRLRLPFSTKDKDYFVEKLGHYFILDGDIIVGDDLPRTMSYSINGDYDDFHWHNASMPIVIDPSIYANGLGYVVHAAITEFNNRTELCLVPRTSEKDYVRISFSMNLGGAAGVSKVGRQGGEQPLSLSASAGKGTVMHELLHAAGFYHEQGRSDRDKFIKIIEDNIQDDKKNQFQIEAGSAWSNYDYCSIMQYPATAFSKNGKPTIECIQNGTTFGCPACFGSQADFSVQDIQGIDKFYSKVSQFPCQTYFPNPTKEQMKFPIIYPTASQAAMNAFRHSAETATKENFVGAYPNFYEATKGGNTVGGTIFLKSTVAQWKDVPLTELGNPSLDDFGARMRATQDYAVRNGYIGGFPNFFHANYGRGIVCGTVLIGNSGAEWRDVPLTELGNPPLNDIGARMRSANDYAVRNGYLSGFPTFYHADYGKGTVCGIVLIKKEAGIWKDVVIVNGPR